MDVAFHFGADFSDTSLSPWKVAPETQVKLFSLIRKNYDFRIGPIDSFQGDLRFMWILSALDDLRKRKIIPSSVDDIAQMKSWWMQEAVDGWFFSARDLPDCWLEKNIWILLVRNISSDVVKIICDQLARYRYFRMAFEFRSDCVIHKLLEVSFLIRSYTLVSQRCAGYWVPYGADDNFRDRIGILRKSRFTDVARLDEIPSTEDIYLTYLRYF